MEEKKAAHGAGAVTEAGYRHAAEFAAKMCWRTDPPNANNKLTDDERLSAIKYHPTIKELGRPHNNLALSEAALRPEEAAGQGEAWKDTVAIAIESARSMAAVFASGKGDARERTFAEIEATLRSASAAMGPKKFVNDKVEWLATPRPAPGELYAKMADDKAAEYEAETDMWSCAGPIAVRLRGLANDIRDADALSRIDGEGWRDPNSGVTYTAAQLADLLAGRDKFIVAHDLWSDFVASLPPPPSIEDPTPASLAEKESK